jgi:hypothetical protein
MAYMFTTVTLCANGQHKRYMLWRDYSTALYKVKTMKKITNKHENKYKY